jgi:hypothetical protein
MALVSINNQEIKMIKVLITKIDFEPKTHRLQEMQCVDRKEFKWYRLALDFVRTFKSEPNQDGSYLNARIDDTSLAAHIQELEQQLIARGLQ